MATSISSGFRIFKFPLADRQRGTCLPEAQVRSRVPVHVSEKELEGQEEKDLARFFEGELWKRL